MPRKTDKMTVASLGLPDRRIRLTPEKREQLFDMHRNGCSIRSITRELGVSRRLVQFTLFPERKDAARNGRTWKDYYDREKHRKAQKEHKLYKKGGLKWPCR